jgi:hypothetical protein
MVSITLNFDDSIETRILNGFCAGTGYTGFESDGTTPITKLNWAKRKLAEHIVNVIGRVESVEAGNAAANAVQADIITNIIIS